MRDPNLLQDGNLLKLSDAAIQSAKDYNVIPDIYFDDYIFNALYVLKDRNLDVAAWNYYMSGRTSAEKIRDIVALHRHRKIQLEKLDMPISMLDFASGYGCVTRHMQNIFPNINVVAMDIHEKAYHFNKDNLGLSVARSQTKPEDVQPFLEFDVVFALSFFSHMPKARFFPWLEKLTEFVKPGGLLIFTTHGQETHKTQMSHVGLDEDGYGFISDSEQFDLSTEDYIHAVTYPKFVLKEIEKLESMDLRMYFKAFWWLHQDAYVLQKIPA
jgi:2-polyprenyl-3-methyl-5-hydroxy-6-metoxy-1,4-benzoquinol methylase